VHGILRTYRDLGKLEADAITYWAPADATQTEVDFLVTRGDEHVAIEVKASTSVRNEHMKGLRAIDALAGVKKRILVYTGSDAQRTPDGVDVWPFERLAQELDAGRV
jgi:predicted AAA+ superfamily ATPase